MDKRENLIDQLPHLMRYARALTRDPDAAEDLVQECVSRALSRLHQFRHGTNMRAWLFTILHNQHRQALRTLARRPRTVEMSDELNNRVGTNPTQVDKLTLRDLGRALEKLNDEQRHVILLVGLEDMSYRETADILDVPVGTVMSRLSRGRDNLRRLMDDGSENILRSVK